MNTLDLLAGADAGMEELETDQLIAREPLADGTRITSLHHLFDGPPPTVRVFDRRADEWCAVAGWVHKALSEQALSPASIKILAMNIKASTDALLAALEARLDGVPVRHVRRGHGPSPDTDAIEILTPHAMKGYEAELVFVVGADRYQADGEPRPRVLYTAMSRARSLLFVSGTRGGGPASERILDALATAKRLLST